MVPEFKIDLGSRVRCKLTGCEGIVTGHHRWLYGCLTYSVKPSVLKNGLPVDSLSFDEGAIEESGGTPLAFEPQSTTTGGPCPVIPPVSR